MIATLRPAAGAPPEEAARCYERIRVLRWERKADIFSRGMLSPCLSHPGCECPLAWRDPAGARPSQRPLTVNVSGTQCTLWSSLGARRGLADSNTESWWVWVAEMSCLRYASILGSSLHTIVCRSCFAAPTG